MHPKLRLLSVISLLIVTLCNCSKSPPPLQTGLKLDQANRQIITPRKIFKPGQPFALLLTPVKLQDHYVTLTVDHRRTDGNYHRVRTIEFKNLDTKLDYIQIPAVISFPFPGRFRISLVQLNTILGRTEITVTEEN